MLARAAVPERASSLRGSQLVNRLCGDRVNLGLDAEAPAPTEMANEGQSRADAD